MPDTFSLYMDLFKKERNLSKRNGGIKKGNAISIKRGTAMFRNLCSKSIDLLWWTESGKREIEDMRIGWSYHCHVVTHLSLKFPGPLINWGGGVGWELLPLAPVLDRAVKNLLNSIYYQKKWGIRVKEDQWYWHIFG